MSGENEGTPIAPEPVEMFHKINEIIDWINEQEKLNKKTRKDNKNYIKALYYSIQSEH